MSSFPVMSSSTFPIEIYGPIYDEMRSRNLRNIQSSGFNVDKEISEKREGRDPRRCLSLYSFPTVNLSLVGERLMTTLSSTFGSDPDVVVYSPSPPDDDGDAVWGKLHWTLLQIQGFKDWEGGKEVKEDNVEFGKMVESYFPHDNKIKIRMCGVIAVKTGLVIVGIPDTNMNAARDQFRDNMKSINPLYPLKEPFLNDIVHSTLLRVCGGDGTGPKADQLLKIAEEYNNVYLGDAYVDKISVGEASWRMMDVELSKTPPMWTWRLEGEPSTSLDNDEASCNDSLNCVSICDSDSLSTSAMGGEDGQYDVLQQFGLEDVGWKRPPSR